MLLAYECDGSCGQGEGDCDWDSDCLPGLVCNWDWWWGTDHCEAGDINTKQIHQYTIKCWHFITIMSVLIWK